MRARTCASFGVATLPVERIYNLGVFTAPPATGNHMVSFSFDPAQVASGVYDTQFENYVAALGSTRKFWLALNHEPEGDYPPANQIAGSRRFCDIVHANSGPNIKTATILMSSTLIGSTTNWLQWYPGDTYIDCIGWDAYYRPKTLRTPQAVYGAAFDAAASRGKPTIIGETGIGAVGHGGHLENPVGSGIYTDIDDSVYNTFVTDTVAYLNAKPPGAMEAICWFNVVKSDGNWTFDCQGYNHLTSRAIWAAAVQNSVQYA